MTCVIGIDPGLSGGMGVYDVAAKKLLEVRPLPITEIKEGRYTDRNIDAYAFAEMIGVCVEAYDVKLVVIEKVHSSPQMGVASAFKFGHNYGIVQMACMIYAPLVELVTPQKWKARMMLSFDKKQSLAMARKMFGHDHFPRQKDEGLAEAALIAFYGARDLKDHADIHRFTEEDEDPLS